MTYLDTRALIGHSTFIPLKLCIFFSFIMPSDNIFIQALTIVNTYGIYNRLFARYFLRASHMALRLRSIYIKARQKNRVRTGHFKLPHFPSAFSSFER